MSYEKLHIQLKGFKLILYKLESGIWIIGLSENGKNGIAYRRIEKIYPNGKKELFHHSSTMKYTKTEECKEAIREIESNAMVNSILNS